MPSMPRLAGGLGTAWLMEFWNFLHAQHCLAGKLAIAHLANWAKSYMQAEPFADLATRKETHGKIVPSHPMLVGRGRL